MRILTANRLVDGEVVFWARGGWTEHFAAADVLADDTSAHSAEAKATGAITEVVDPYIIEVAALDASGEAVGLAIAPVSYRERLRALGPSNKPNHGKQAAGGPDIERLAHARGAARSAGRVNLIRRK